MSGYLRALTDQNDPQSVVALEATLDGELKVAGGVGGVGDASAANQTTGNTSVASIDTKTPALGQALAAASTPVILPAATITALTPPAAITGFATAAKQDTEAVLAGGLAETAPASDTASSGLNGRLQRIAQRLSSMIALLPTALGGAGGLKVENVAALPAGEMHVGSLGGHTVQNAPTVTVSTTPAYTAGDVVGGKLTLTSAMRVSGGSGILQSLFLMELGTQKPALEVLIFNADPSAGTYTDNSAFPNNATDMAKCIRRIQVAAADWVSVGTYAIADLSPGGRALVAVGSANLYAVIVVGIGASPTFGATSALTARFGILQD